MARQKTKRVLFYTIQDRVRKDVVAIVDAKVNAERQVLESASRTVGIETVRTFEEWDLAYPDGPIWWRLAVDLEPGLPIIYEGDELIGIDARHTMVVSALDWGGDGVTVATQYDPGHGIPDFSRVNQVLHDEFPDREMVAIIAVFDLDNGEFVIQTRDPTTAVRKLTVVDKSTKPKTWVTAG